MQQMEAWFTLSLFKDMVKVIFKFKDRMQSEHSIFLWLCTISKKGRQNIVVVYCLCKREDV